MTEPEDSLDAPVGVSREAPEAIFASLALLAGLALLLVTPPFGNPDEHVHLARAMLVSQGRWWAPGQAPWARAEIPKSVSLLEHRLGHAPPTSPPRKFTAAEIRRLLEQPLDPQDTVSARYLGYYPPLAYAPQAVALWVARRLGPSSPAALVYVGRLGNLLSYVALGWLALRVAPVRRWALFLLLLAPMNVAQASSLSADAPTLALAVLFFALACRTAFGAVAPWPLRRARALLAAGVGLGLVKPGYWTLAGLGLLTPSRSFPSRHARGLALGALLAAMVMPSALWGALVAASQPYSPSPVADPRAQLVWVLAHPLAFARTLLQALELGIPIYVETFVGRLGHLNILLPGWLLVGYPIALTTSVLTDPRDPPALDGCQRAVLVGLFAMGAGGIFLLSYIGWNSVGAPLIEGVQGRYFAPLAPLLLLAIPAREIGRLSASTRAEIFGGAAALALAVAALAVGSAFFGAA